MPYYLYNYSLLYYLSDPQQIKYPISIFGSGYNLGFIVIPHYLDIFYVATCVTASIHYIFIKYLALFIAIAMLTHTLSLTISPTVPAGDPPATNTYRINGINVETGSVELLL